MNEDLEEVADAVERVRQFLLDYGDVRTAPFLVPLEDRLRGGDATVLVQIVSLATGGMGSLQDRWICRENGDTVAADEVIAVNKRLHEWVRELGIKARSAAADRSIELSRSHLPMLTHYGFTA